MAYELRAKLRTSELRLASQPKEQAREWHSTARWLLSSVAMLLASTAASAWPQTLGEVADMERERREQIEDSAKVYTEDDLDPARAAVAETRRRLEIVRTLELQPSPPRSELATQREAGEKVLGPVMDSIRAQVTLVQDDFRRYLDACYQRFTEVNSSGYSVGAGTAWTWNRYVDFAWQEGWVGGSSVDNSTTVYCRSLWSDIEANGTSAMAALREVSEVGRRGGLFPGIMRDLFAQYGLTLWAP